MELMGAELGPSGKVASTVRRALRQCDKSRDTDVVGICSSRDMAEGKRPLTACCGGERERLDATLALGLFLEQLVDDPELAWVDEQNLCAKL